MEQIPQHFHHPMVRHLAWCLFSPDLGRMDNYPPVQTGNAKTLKTWLADLDNNPTKLEKFIQSRNHQLLGSYFECLWQFFFTYGPNWQLLKDHFQVSSSESNGNGKPSPTKTMGELDILAEDDQQQAWHIELAVKFFLKLPDASGAELEHWVGPQSRDRLDKKLNKLSRKQFPFLTEPATQQALQEQSLTKKWKQGLLLKGYLFKPKNQEYELPSSVPKTAHLSTWCHIRDLGLTIPRHSYYVLLPKHEWLGPYYGLHIDVWDFPTMIENAKQHFQSSENKYALMIAQVDKFKDNWIEMSRWLVVHNEWPEPIKQN